MSLNNSKNLEIRQKLPKLAILGAGGLGIEMLAVLTKRTCLNPVAILDKEAFLFEEKGLDLEQTYSSLSQHKSVSKLTNSVKSKQTIQELLSRYKDQIDCVFYALPNLPNDFIYQTTKEIISLGFKGTIVDALKRTSAFKLISKLNSELKEAGALYISGCGATPGLLTAVSNIAAQSFVEIKSIEITFGVGIANWEAYRATIREDIAHLKDYSLEQASKMSETEISELLNKTNGILKLENMEHADDIMLELAGICDLDQVSVGGIVDTRNPQKPISTNVKITGITYLGEESTHQFILGDQTTMAANVCGPVLGYLNTGIKNQRKFNLSGFYSAVDFMPQFSPTQIYSQENQDKKALAYQTSSGTKSRFKLA